MTKIGSQTWEAITIGLSLIATTIWLILFQNNPFKYFEKIQTSEIIFCEDHDREFLVGEECPGCRSEHDDYEIERSVGVRVQVKKDD